MARVLLAALALVLAFPASTASASDPAYPSLAGKWQLGEFTADGGFAVRTAAPLPANGVGFPFLDRPDTIILLTEHPAYRGRLLGDLTGKRLAATVGVDVTAGAQFGYFGEPDGSGTPANVRLYFETDISLGPIVCPCQDKGWSSFWYSNPVKLDLAALKTGDATLTVDLDPTQWADGQEVPATADADHLSSFATAVAHVDHVGLTFGGGRHFHDGVGIVPGTGSGSFELLAYRALRG
jgi:hypothetical protein